MNNQLIQQELAKIESFIAAQEAMRGTLPDEQIESALTQLGQKKAALTAQLSEDPAASYDATVKGGGAAAQGTGATAVGAGGVSVGGSVSGSIITGDDNKITQIGGDMVKGDKVGGDKVGGDKISVGDISGSSGVAIGRKAQAHVTQGISGAELAALFQTVYKKINTRPPDPDVEKEEIVAQVQKIEAEAATQAEPNERVYEQPVRQ